MERARAESPSVHYRWARANKAQEKAKKKDEKYNKIKANVEGFNKFLFDAIGKGNLRDVKYCLQNGANVNAKDRHHVTALHEAAKYGGMEIVKLLVNHGADVAIKTALGQTALDLAKDFHNTEIYKYVGFDQNRILHT